MRNVWVCCILLGLATLLVLFESCGGTAGSATPPATPASAAATKITVITIATGINTPVDLQQPRDGTSRLFVVEKAGTIRIVQNGTVQAVPFLDITSKVDSLPGEMGLLGLAFHPGYAQNHRFFVHYDRDVNGQLQSVISEFAASTSDPGRADPSSEHILLTVNQPFTNHKGGQMAFGPDGFLYIALGDGGSEGDPQGNGQNRQTLLGKILRINVDATAPGTQYAIPADNPFLDRSGLPEIWAYGLRNPWRFSFDRYTGRLFAGDVGGDQREEVDIIERGANYGWNIMEGSLCLNPPSGCNSTGLILPIAEYDHSEGNAIIGGYVYAGNAIPSLQHAYVFGDLGTGKIWTLRETSTGSWNRTLLLNANAQISSFGQDEAGEVYILQLSGTVLRFTAQ
jgi:glucose/arabinose dehydrogenase